MKIYKFGGASVQDALGIKNLLQVLEKTQSGNLVIVVSAMGKTTNALEKVLYSYFENDNQLAKALSSVKAYHNETLKDLFPNENNLIFKTVERYFEELDAFLDRNKSPNYNFVYDQVVCYGELICTKIIHSYLEQKGIKCKWLDIRECLKTNDNYREADVNWEITQQLISEQISGNEIIITQGFIASDANGFTTTLGREGSDYSAAILGYCLNAESVTIWKDVPGVLSADPRYFKKAELLNRISYQEAIELAFYGATVIHPKTLQPLQLKEIPLYVKSFINPLAPGTCVTKGELIEPLVPCYILKRGQVLISLSSLDFSFIVEEGIGEVFKLLGKYKMKVDLIQNSAISFSVCVDNKFGNLDELIAKLKADFKVIVYKNVDLFTIRHFNPQSLKQLEKDKNILVKQVAQNTVQLVAM